METSEDTKNEFDNLIQTAFGCYEVQRAVTRNLSLEDLKSLRLVNKQWMQAASHSLKEKCVITLDSPSLFQNYLLFLDNQQELENFDNDGDKCALYFTNFKITIKPDKFRSLNEATQLFTQFWEKCGSFVKELSFQFPWTCSYPILTQIYCLDQQAESYVNVNIERLALSILDKPAPQESDGNDKSWSNGLDEETTSTLENEQENNFIILSNPALISLHLNVSIVLSTEKKVFPFSWIQFLEACPNICHLSIQSDYGSGHFVRIVNTLVDNRVILKTLKIGTRDQRLFSDDYLKKLVLLTGNKTEVVSLGFLPSVKHNTPIDYILRHGAPSLKHLTFLQYRTSNQSTLTSLMASEDTCSSFPNMESFRFTKELVQNMAFLCKMPKLKRLEIYRDSTIGQHDTLSNPVIRTRSLSVVMQHLQSLVLEPFVPLEHVWKLTTWFPNLRRLQMKANDMIARVIFMKWQELKELFLIAEITRDNNDIVRSALTDEGITGMTRQELEVCSCEEPGHVGVTRTMAYIGNLTKLETCKIQAVHDYQTGITDYSVMFGLNDIASLQTVCFVKTLVSQLSVDNLRGKGINVIISRE